MNPLVPYRIFPCGDHAITLELGNKVDESINRQIISRSQWQSQLLRADDKVDVVRAIGGG